MDPENAHHLVIDGLHNATKIPGALTLMRGMYGVPEVPELATDLFGIHFPSPVGLAAGLDKTPTRWRVFRPLASVLWKWGR
ncbi:hypothetical protein HMSSN036_63090 [Paenibacillus macerans]|nr:hypothetical protein HMSSN036_63090 [Paenibacillus macerans]